MRMPVIILIMGWMMLAHGISYSAPSSPKVNRPKQVPNSRVGSVAGNARKSRQLGSDKSSDSARGGLVQGKTSNKGALVRTSNAVQRATPLPSSVRHRSPNPAVVSGSLTSRSAHTGTIDGSRMSHKM